MGSIGRNEGLGEEKQRFCDMWKELNRKNALPNSDNPTRPEPMTKEEEKLTRNEKKRKRPMYLKRIGCRFA